MKRILTTAAIALTATLAPSYSQSVVDKVKNGVERAVDNTKEAVETAVDKTTSTVRHVTERTKEGAENTVDKIRGEDEPETVTERRTVQTTTTAPVVATTPAPVAETTTVATTTTPDLSQKIESDLGRPMTQAETEKYADALVQAQDQNKATKDELAAKIHEITGISTEKARQMISDKDL